MTGKNYWQALTIPSHNGNNRREYVFSQLIQPSEYNYLVYAENDGAINTSLNIIGEKYALSYFEKIQEVTGIFSGFIFGISVFLIFLGFKNKDIFLFLSCRNKHHRDTAQLNDLGLLYPLWQDSPRWNQEFSIYCASISTFFGCRLARSYLLSKYILLLLTRFFSGLNGIWPSPLFPSRWSIITNWSQYASPFPGYFPWPCN